MSWGDPKYQIGWEFKQGGHNVFCGLGNTVAQRSWYSLLGRNVGGRSQLGAVLTNEGQLAACLAKSLGNAGSISFTWFLYSCFSFNLLNKDSNFSNEMFWRSFQDRWVAKRACEKWEDLIWYIELLTVSQIIIEEYMLRKGQLGLKTINLKSLFWQQLNGRTQCLLSN